MSAVEYWEQELDNLAPGTASNYRYYVGLFMDYLGTDVEGLYELQRGYVSDGDPRSNRVIPLKLAKFIRQGIEDGWSTGFGANVANGVRHFFRANVLEFPFRASDIPAPAFSGSRVILRDEIARWLVLCAGCRFELRNRAITLVSKDVGFRVSDVARLTCRHVFEAQVIDTDQGRFRVFKPFRTLKRGVLAFPHWGPEAEEAVMLYLGDRREGPLFLSSFGKQMNAKTIGEIYRRFKKREGTPKLSHHSLRKFHRTALEARMPESYVKKLQGKKTDPYIHPEQTGELTEAYIRYYDAIRVYREAREVEHLKQELEAQREEHTDLERRLRDAERYIEQQRIEQAVRRELDKQGR